MAAVSIVVAGTAGVFFALHPTGAAIGVMAQEIIPHENGTIEVYFCPRDDCETVLAVALANATTIDCAFYDLNSEKIITVLKTKPEIRIVLERDNSKNIGEEFGDEKSFRVKLDTNRAYMHNKFCILDNRKIITGSTNPTLNDLKKNNNNLLVITSPSLAKNYRTEFEELWSNDGKATPFPQMYLNEALVENYFCPEDTCEENVVKTLATAEKSIYFMTFSFTSDPIGKVLTDKSTRMPVTGIFEKKQRSQYSEFNQLKDTAQVIWDNNPNMMHHKVFIIDNETVITGSFNPTQHGTAANDENVLIIHSPEIAGKYLEEFEELWKGK